ncbi:MAG: redoxin domain-containing protein [Planctomycetota bacterium]
MNRLIPAALLCLAVTPGLAQEAAPKADRPTPRLQVGDPAPALSVEKWVKGQPVPKFEAGKVYVVEFWATWCGPCIASMPHLSKLQRDHGQRGLTVIGVSSRDPNNSLEKVEAMVAAKGPTMGYTVAWDKERDTNSAYMDAAEQRGIPCSFVIDGTGKIAYIGHPMWLDMPIEGILAGTWDPKSSQQQIAAFEAELVAALRSAEDDPAAALGRLDKLAAQHPSVMAQFDDNRFDLMLRCGRFEDASKLGQQLTTRAIDARDAETLNRLSWTIVDPESSWATRDLDLALRAATKAVEFTENKDAAVLDTLARVYFRQGDVVRAIATQERAVELAPERMKPDLQNVLDEYRKARGVKL